MGTIFTYANIPIIICLIVALILFIIMTVFLVKYLAVKKEEKKFLDQLKLATNSAYAEDLNDLSPIEKWNKYWGDLLKQSDMIEKTQSNSQIGTALILIPLIIWGLVTIITANAGLGILPGGAVLLIIRLVAISKLKKKKALFDDQIPAFLGALKSNIQANSTPEKALIDAINTTTSPLYDELKIAKSFVATSSFSVALKRLREETSSADLRFLCSCVELSSKLGSNLEDQLDIIENMIEEKKELRRLLDKAIAENRPLLYVASGILPLLFVLTYIMNEPTREFWFKVPISWVVFFGIIIIFSGAVWLSNRFIKKLDDLR